MKYGYMSGFRADLLSEIKFAKEHFDFVEITLKPQLLGQSPQYFLKLKTSLKTLEVVGHVHWEIKELEKIYKNIKILKKLGAKKITIHPFSNNRQSLKQNVQNNIILLSQINDFCRKNKLQLLIENISSGPFNRAYNLAKILDEVPNLGIVLDIGHANRVSKMELNRFLKEFKSKIKHIHLHDNVGESDHLFFRNRAKLKKILTKIISVNYNGTITLETFAVLKNKQYLSLQFSGIKKQHIKQLETIRNFCGL
jgi:sugar phosphate isomerase/epimerase